MTRVPTPIPITLTEKIFGEKHHIFFDEDEYTDFLIRCHRHGYTLKRATVSGYLSRKIVGKVMDYNGRYGKGFIIHKPRFDVTGFHDAIYIIKMQSDSAEK